MQLARQVSILIPDWCLHWILQIWFALSNITSWRTVDGDFDYQIFWDNIINFFKDALGPAAWARMAKLLEWWTRWVVMEETIGRTWCWTLFLKCQSVLLLLKDSRWKMLHSILINYWPLFSCLTYPPYISRYIKTLFTLCIQSAISSWCESKAPGSLVCVSGINAITMIHCVISSSAVKYAANYNALQQGGHSQSKSHGICLPFNTKYIIMSNVPNRWEVHSLHNHSNDCTNQATYSTLSNTTKLQEFCSLSDSVWWLC
jgi:hypothetical protein